MIITLTTDFGHTDPFVGIMKGVMLGICPNANIVDLCHHVPAQSISVGAFMLATSARYFPPGTVHVAVVDPGVGSDRDGIAVQSRGHYFIGPNNGLLTMAAA